MKKTLTFIAVAVVATAAHGASIAWSLSNVAFDGSKITSAGSELTASLFFLGNGGSLASSYTEAEIASLDIVATASGTNTKSANTGTYDLVSGVNANGDVFGMLLSYTSGGKTYYNIASTVYTLSGYDNDTSTPDKYNLTAASMTYTVKEGTSSSVSPGGGWTAVPEPSTAALALAGLAFLLKRRKA